MAVARLTEDQSRDVLARMRWGDDGTQVCQDPDCGLRDQHYWIRSRKQWRCRLCGSSFSVTTKTAFADRKLPLTTLLCAIAYFAQSPKGLAALKLSHLISVAYKTAFVLLHKIREAIILTDDPTPLSGEVEVDGARFNHHIRKANRIEHRIDQRLERNQSPNRAEIITMRQRGEPGAGAVRTAVAVVRRETDMETVHEIRAMVAPGATIISDEAPIFRELARFYNHQTVVHAECYSSPDGVNENQAESYFARIRRSQYGEHHRFSRDYLIRYAKETAFREDTRRSSDHTIWNDLLNRCMAAGTTSFRGYWQRGRIRRGLMAA